MNKRIIDVSKWNAITNFSTIHEKVDGVIVRVGFRGNVKPTLNADPRYIPYMVELNKYGNPLGAYFMTSAITEEEAKEEANFFIDCIESTGVKLSIPLFVKTDWTISTHDGRSDNIDSEVRTNNIKAFIAECKKRGYGCGIAATDKWFKEHLCLDQLVGYAKWITNKIDKISLKDFDDAVMIKAVNDRFEVKGIAGYLTSSEINLSILGPYIKKVEKKPKKDEVVEKTEYKVFDPIKLKKAELYKTSISSTVIDVINGTHYIANEKILRGRIRISKKINGPSIGWININ